MLKRVMTGYTGEALNGYSILTSSDDQRLFTVVSLGDVRGKMVVDAGLIVRVAGDQIVIEKDVNNKQLVDALMQAGIAREQIVLAYAGEQVRSVV
jgi:hypothetical protein